MGNKLNILIQVCILIMIGGLCFLGGTMYSENQIDGMWTRNNFGFEGDWIHINIDNMDYERCEEVAAHECAHELFAEICESNNEMCLLGQALLNNYSKKP